MLTLEMVSAGVGAGVVTVGVKLATDSYPVDPTGTVTDEASN